MSERSAIECVERAIVCRTATVLNSWKDKGNGTSFHQNEMASRHDVFVSFEILSDLNQAVLNHLADERQTC